MSSLVEDPGADTWEGLDLNRLGIDQAYLRVVNKDQQPLWVYGLSQDCYQCPFQRLEEDGVLPGGNITLVVSTQRDMTLRLRSNSSEFLAPEDPSHDPWSFCQVWAPLDEFGVYQVEATGQDLCHLHQVRQPVNIYFAFLVCILVYLGLVVGWRLARGLPGLWTRWRGNSVDLHCQPRTPQSSSDQLTGAPPPSDKKPKKRLKSLDTFRGMTIIVMIFVNDGAGDFWFMNHSTWNGLQVADLVFPWFMWIMGVCIPISMRSILSRGTPRAKIMRKILKRSLTLFAFGLCLNSIDHLSLEKLRIMGVLQRFAVTYLALATMAMLLQRPVTTPQPTQNKAVVMLRDVLALAPQWAIMLVVLLVHQMIVFFLPVPGCPTGYLGPGGIHLGGMYWNCTGGATGYVDRVVLGLAHVYQHPTTQPVYLTGPYDPEGLLGCLTSAFQVFLGVQAGTTLLHFPGDEWRPRVRRWVAWGVFLGVVAAVLCKCSAQDGWVPLNKNMWSLSFVLATSCMAFLLLSSFFVLIDVLSWWDGTPFFYPGMNSILLYMGHEIMSAMLPFHWAIFAMRTHSIRLAESLWVALLWVIASVFFYKKGIFLKV